MRILAFASLVALGAPSVSCAEEVRTADATIAVSSSTAATTLGLTLVEGTMHHHGKVYLLTLRGAQPSAAQ